MTLPTVPDFVVGEVLTAAKLDQLSTAVTFLLDKPSVSATRTNYTVADSSHAAVPLTGEDFDTDSMHSTVTNSSRLTCVTPGKYLVIASGLWSSNTAGRRTIEIVANGNSSAPLVYATQTAGTEDVGAVAHTCSRTISLTAGDYVEIWHYQTAGGDLALDAFLSATMLAR